MFKARDVSTDTPTVATTDTQRDTLTDAWQTPNRYPNRGPDRCRDRQTGSLSHSTHPPLQSMPLYTRAACKPVTLQCMWIKTTMAKKSIIELHFNMAMIKDWIKRHSSKIRRLEHAVAHAMGYIKLQSIFCLFRKTWQMELKKWKRCALSTLNDLVMKKIK